MAYLYTTNRRLFKKYNRWPLVLLDNIKDSTLVEENFSCMDNSW